MTTSPQSPPQSELERFLLAELPPGRMEELRRLRETDPAFKARLETLRASDAEILERHPPGAVAAGIRRRRAAFHAALSRPAAAPVATGTLRPRPIRFAVPVFAMAALGLALVLHFPRFQDPDPGTPGFPEMPRAGGNPEGVRLKGSEAGLIVFRKTRNGSELLPPGAAGKPGDTLQVFYHSSKALHGLVFSVDGRGMITLHYPESEGLSAPLRIGDMNPLPHAFRLDKAPRLERFYLVTYPEPFACAGILAEARRIFARGRAFPDSLAGLAEGFRQYSYTIRKPGSDTWSSAKTGSGKGEGR